MLFKGPQNVFVETNYVSNAPNSISVGARPQLVPTGELTALPRSHGGEKVRVRDSGG